MEPSVGAAAAWFASLGVGGILAWGMFQVHRKDMKQTQEAWQGQTALLMKVVQENTQAQAEVKALVAAALQTMAEIRALIISAQRNGGQK